MLKLMLGVGARAGHQPRPSSSRACGDLVVCLQLERTGTFVLSDSGGSLSLSKVALCCVPKLADRDGGGGGEMAYRAASRSLTPYLFSALGGIR